MRRRDRTGDQLNGSRRLQFCSSDCNETRENEKVVEMRTFQKLEKRAVLRMLAAPPVFGFSMRRRESESV